MIKLIETAIFFSIFIIFSAYLSLLERKIIARVQRRRGPNHCGVFGILQPIADMLKIFFKCNALKDKSILSIFAVCLFLISNLFMISIIPYSDSIDIFTPKNSLLYVIIFDSLMACAELLMGITSGSKYGMIGGVRSYIQSIGIFLPLSLSIINIFLITGTLNLSEIASVDLSCSSSFSMFIVFIIFFITSFMMINRPPFDFSEAESELVAGVNTEYGGILFGLIYLGEYLRIIAVSSLIVVLFLGGGAHCGFLSYELVFGIKLIVVIILTFIIRAIFPRYRQVTMIKISWGNLTYISVGSIIFSLIFAD